MRRRLHRNTTQPTLSDFSVCIEVGADAASAAREFIVRTDLPADHPAVAFFRAWDKEIAQAQIDLAEGQQEYAERLAEEKAEQEAAGARDFLLAVMKGEATATENQIAAAEALVRASA